MKDKVKIEEKDFTGLVSEGLVTIRPKESDKAGGYEITGGSTPSIKFMFDKKPNWFHRFFSRLFLGWIWEDEKKEKKNLLLG